MGLRGPGMKEVLQEKGEGTTKEGENEVKGGREGECAELSK